MVPRTPLLRILSVGHVLGRSPMLLQPGSRPVPNCPDYILVRKRGAGAFGQVWHAHGPGGLDVALKFIRLDAQVFALELRSLEVMKKIRHPNLVSLFGAWHKDDWLILAMELCDGTLQDRLTEALDQELPGIPLEELLNYMADAAKGLDALNAKQVQHRDVKPANLLLLDSGVKVADFGLAKALEKTIGSNSRPGTVAYAAPECFNGELTQQTDQYSLAVTYYHLRTGNQLFEGNQLQLMYAHLELEPDLSRLSPPEGVVLARALSKEPGKRWKNCKAFVSELRSAQQEMAQQAAEQRERLAEIAELQLQAQRSLVPEIGDIFEAVKRRDARAVQVILQQDPRNAALIGESGWTPLHYAAGTNAAEVADVLLRHGAPVNAGRIGDGTPLDESGWTPLHCAAWENAVEVAKVLLNYGAQVNAAEDDGLTPLHCAAWKNAVEVAEVLLNYGAQVNTATPIGGTTPLHDAIRYDAVDVAEILLECGADASALDSVNRTPLHYAWEAKALARVIQLLVRAGADINHKDNSDETVLDIALELGKHEAADILQRFGAKKSNESQVPDQKS